MAKRKGVIPDADAWRRMSAQIERLESAYRNIRPQRASPRLSGGGVGFIEFALSEELRRGQTAAAVHLPWEDEPALEDLEVIEKNKLASELRAPAGTTGFAIKRSIGWVIITLDCDALEPHDGDPQ